MARKRSDKVLVVEIDASGTDVRQRRTPDELVVEEPMTIQLDGHVVATTMRTPGNDYELAVGFCHGDGLLGGAPVTGVRYCANGSAMASEFNVVTVETMGRAPVPTPRLGTTSSSCGLCGSENIDELARRLEPLTTDRVVDIDPAVVVGIPSRVLGDQTLFASTGAVHAAAVFDADGVVSMVREDVGRHNAVDKVVGALLLEKRLPAHDHGLFVSGRASFEMVQKAWAAGFGTVVSVSAPTSLAVQTARRAGITLYGFARDRRMVRYAPN
jgi:FdhD protein